LYFTWDDHRWPTEKRWPGPDALTIAACLLQHLLGHQFARYFPLAEDLAKSNRDFAVTCARCWKFDQSEQADNSPRSDEPQRHIKK
jgi:hypothetical protein